MDHSKKLCAHSTERRESTLGDAGGPHTATPRLSSGPRRGKHQGEPGELYGDARRSRADAPHEPATRRHYSTAAAHIRLRE
eukprot:COSAG03_NODE_798_length_5810_cov_4.253371_4_plen_81_part_00